MFPELTTFISALSVSKISLDRKLILQDIIEFITNKQADNEPVKLNFICTHNSRRSQLAQIWAQTAASYFNLNIACFSGGVEVTAFNKNAVSAIERAGFAISKEGEENPIYLVKHTSINPGITVFSKLYDDVVNPNKGFAAIMTCSEADENCPFIPGAEVRIPLLYEDPKEFDNTPVMAEKYQQRSKQIATEMFYIFSQINAQH